MSIASRCLPLLLPPAGPCRLAFGSVAVASRCLPLLLPPAGPCRLAFGFVFIASRGFCLRFPDTARGCKKKQAPRGPSEARPRWRLLNPFQASFEITGCGGGRAKRGPRGASLNPFQASFKITVRRGGRAKRGPRGALLSFSIFPLSVWGSMPVSLA